MKEKKEKGLSLGDLELVLRQLRGLQALYEDYGISEITVRGTELNLFDLIKAISTLPDRQREAVLLMCVEDMKEVDAAKIISAKAKWGTSIGVYKKMGLQQISDWFWGNPVVISSTNTAASAQLPEPNLFISPLGDKIPMSVSRPNK